MTAQPDRPLIIRLSAEQAAHPDLLQGLEVWLELGLISDRQLRQISREYLACPVEFAVAPAPRPRNDFARLPGTTANPSQTTRSDTDRRSLPASPADPPVVRLAERTLQTFMAEISVIWLLFLGVFLVVVSSGVLAASQWQNFSSVGQYGILLAYTLAFFGVSVWTSRQPNLHLTAKMLQVTTLLIIPVNFWMMDSLGVGQSAIGIALGTIAAFSLTGIVFWLLRPGSGLAASVAPRLTIFNQLGLSWLHLGWNILSLPLFATYLGTVGTAGILFWQAQQVKQQVKQQRTVNPVAPATPAPAPAIPAATPLTTTIVLALSTLLLIGRATLLSQVPLHRLGLALGICGWLLCWLLRQEESPQSSDQPSERPAVWGGIALLFLGWAISVSNQPPLQAIAISGLALWLLIDRLYHWRQPSVLLTLLLVGFQTYALIWRVLPDSVRQSILTLAQQNLGGAGLPEVLTGLAGFPYLWLILALAAWLRRLPASAASSTAALPAATRVTIQSSEDVVSQSLSWLRSAALAQQADLIALILGLAFTLVSLPNAGVRSLTLLLAALTLAGVVWKRSQVPTALIYLTHIAAIAVLLSWIDWQLPALSNLIWARILLGMMAVEWGLSLVLTAVPWRRSAWFIGLALATISYLALVSSPFERGSQTLIWLLVPLLLTGLSRLSRFWQPRLAAWLSTAALLALLLLLSSFATWTIGLATATGLMLVNTATLRHLVPASLTIGFALGLEIVLLWWRWGDQITEGSFALLLAGTLWGLWLLQDWLNRRSTSLRTLYTDAIQGWGIAVCGFALLFLTALSLLAYSSEAESWQWVLGSGLVMVALLYRLRQPSSDLRFYGLAWSVETTAALLVAQLNGGAEALAIVNLALGFLTQVGGDIRVRRSNQPYRSSWHLIPLMYAAIGLGLGHLRLTPATGLYTFAAALVGLGIGRRFAQFKPLTLISLLLVSVAAYELLLDRLLRVEAGNPGDGIVLMAGLAAIIAWVEFLCTRWLVPYLRLTQPELSGITLLHWVAGSGLAWLAIQASPSTRGVGLLIGVALLLTTYALAQGNQRWAIDPVPATSSTSSTPPTPPGALPSLTPSSSLLWTYAGIVQFLFTLSYGLYQLLPDDGWLLAWAGIIASGVALGMATLPWRQWGWSQQPWNVAAAVFPVLVLLLTSYVTALQSLLVAAAFYAWFAKRLEQIRLSYLSIVLLDWAVLRFVGGEGWLNSLWLSGILAGSLLYVAQIDPALQAQSARGQRHSLRTLATGLICLTALYQFEQEIGVMAWAIGFLTLVFSIGLIFLGLFLRVRAFLYVGTLTFILRILRWLWLFINTYSLLLWAVGIVLGLLFIWLAATFEARRSQVDALVQYWSTELETWE